MNGKQMSEARRRAVIAFLKEGKATMAETARLAGCTPQNIYLLVERQRLDPKTERDEYLRQLWAATLEMYEKGLANE